MIFYFNTVLNAVCDTLLLPFRSESPWPMMAAVSLVTALLALFVFKKFSDQDAVRRSKSVMIARMLELLLFKDDFVVGFGAVGRLLKANLVYQKELLKPLGILVVPLLLFLVQISCWFGASPLKPGEKSLIKVVFNQGTPVESLQVGLSSSNGLEIETEGLRIPALNEIDWRFAARQNGKQWFDLDVAGNLSRKQVVVGNIIAKVSETRVNSGIWDELTHPVERPLDPKGLVHSIEVAYPKRDIRFGNFKMHWLVAFSVLSLFFGLALKRPFNVEF